MASLNPPTAQASLAAALSSEIDRVLSSLVPAGSQVALVNFANHSNPGDPAIWLGQQIALRRIGVSIGYQCAWSSYDRETLARSVPEGVILLNGGGNFGDLYRGQQQTREQLLEDFVGRPVIQLPQSICFENEVNLDRMRRLCEGQGNFTLLVRERQSLAMAERYFDVPSQLCPDMAFALGSLQRVANPTTAIMWLARQDRESTGYESPRREPHVWVTDWIGPVPGEPAPQLAIRLASRVNRLLVAKLAAGTRAPRWLWRVLAPTFRPMARHWVQRGLWVLSQGQGVITDRLHGHILAVLLGIPHVVMDNNYGKVRSVYETYTSISQLAHWAETAEQALEIARTLVPDWDRSGASATPGVP